MLGVGLECYIQPGDFSEGYEWLGSVRPAEIA